MAIREGRWDCQYCGSIGNLGRDRACYNCGRSRPAGTKFYLADDAEVKDLKLQQQAKIGPDWVCAFCGTSNAADIEICGSCGHTRDESDAVQETKDFELGQAPTTGDMTIEEDPRAQSEAPPPETSKRRLSPLAIAGIIGAVAILCIGIILAFTVFGSKEVGATVSGFSWERTVDIETFRTVTEEDWSVPSDGRLLSQREEIHHYNQVIDHYETRQRQVQVQVGVETYVCGQRDLGNGFFEDIECSRPVYETQTENYEEPIYVSVPVYQPMFTYEIDKWVVDRTETASGNDHSPFWPRADLSDDEREGDRSEQYLIYFTDEENESYTWEVPEDEFERFELNQKVNLKLNALDDLSEVEIP
jgi:hypothetical protein